MGIPRDHAGRDILSKFLILLPLRAVYFRSYHYETPCIINTILIQSIMHLKRGPNFFCGYRVPDLKIVVQGLYNIVTVIQIGDSTAEILK